MRIRNDLVSIKIGKKQYDFNNLILNEYLNRFAKSQLDKNSIRLITNDKELSYCLLKFDTPLEINENTELYNQDFDICILSDNTNIVQEISEQEITIKYTYNSNLSLWDYKKNTADNIKISDYNNKKITAIGFNSYFAPSTDLKVCAVLDVSNYNIYLQENQDLTITRKDIISSDTVFWTENKKVKGPVHLAPSGITILENGFRKAQGILYSVGFSSFIDYIDKEFVIGKDIQAIQENNEIKIEGIENYLSNESALYPSISLYPSHGIYPRKPKYKYLILKYKVWQDVVNGDEYIATDTGLYYHQAIRLNKHGLTNLKIKYERS